jgi:hypothetical protein
MVLGGDLTGHKDDVLSAQAGNPHEVAHEGKAQEGSILGEISKLFWGRSGTA